MAMKALLVFLSCLRSSFGQENPYTPFLPFKHLHANAAIEGPQPWFDGEVPSKDHCFHKCIKQDFTNCEYVQYKEVTATTWLCKLFGVISDLSNYLVSSTEGFMLSQAIHQNIDCQDWFERGYTEFGNYYIYHDRKKLKVRCVMLTNPTKHIVGGYIEIQRRVDGSISFDREWQDYKEGFGSPEEEYWMGLDFIHKLTYGRNTTLNIHGRKFSGMSRSTFFHNFYIEDEANNYRLHSGVPDVTFGGNAGDWVYSDGAEFTTKDRDFDDRTDLNCAQRFEGGKFITSGTQQRIGCK